MEDTKDGGPEAMVTDGELAGAAREAMKNAYAPYSGFRVGAAALTDSGRIYTGTNVENASYGLTICAERVAVFKAVSEGHSGITRVAVVSSSGEMTFPCGACRQVINEFAPAAQIITADSSGQVRRHNIETLLPNAFGPQNLKG